VFHLHHWVGRRKQLDYLSKKKKNQQQRQNQKKGRGRVFTLILLYKTYYTKSKENEFFNAFAP